VGVPGKGAHGHDFVNGTASHVTRAGVTEGAFQCADHEIEWFGPLGVGHVRGGSVGDLSDANDDGGAGVYGHLDSLTDSTELAEVTGSVGAMRIALGSDHAGYDLKALVATALAERGHDVVDLGPDNATTSVDYPDYGAAVGRAVTNGTAELGVAICGSGIGISIAANKIPGVRAALVHDATSGRLAREHNHANVLCLGARLLGPQVALDALDAWLGATPGDGRHIGRIEKLGQLDH